MKKNYMLSLAVLFTTLIFAQNNDFTNGGSDALWSNAANWSSGVPNATQVIRTANGATSLVDQNYTILGLQNLNSTSGDRFVNSSNGGIVTINPATATLGSAIAITNVSSSAVKLGLRGRVTINNTTASSFSRIQNANNSGNSIEFEGSSVLTLTTPLEVFKTTAATGSNIFNFNGKIEGAGNFRVAGNTTATFGNSVSNTGYTGEVVLLGGSSIVVNTTDNTIFYDGPKIQVNGNSSVILNGSNVFASNIVVGGANTFGLTVNKNQSSVSNIIFSANGTINLTLAAAVTNLSFADNSASSWGTGTLNIINYVPGVVRFGTDNMGLTAGQIAQITVSGSGGAVALDSAGYLVNASTLSLNNLENSSAKRVSYPTLADNTLFLTTPQQSVQIYDVNGRTVFQNQSNNQTEVSITSLNKGLYFIVLNNKKVEKFIKK